MKVFVESKKLWTQCGVRIEEHRTGDSNWVCFVLLLLSQGSYFVLSVLYIVIYFVDIDVIQLLYIGLQAQMAFLALSSFFCLNQQNKEISKMIQNVQRIVDESNYWSFNFG